MDIGFHPLTDSLPRDKQGQIVARGTDEILHVAAMIRKEMLAARRDQRRRLKDEPGRMQHERRARRFLTEPPWEFLPWDGEQRLIRSYEDFVCMMIARRMALGWTQLELDERAGWQHGYTGKLEAYASPNGRIAGAVTMPLWWGALGVTLLPVLTVSGTIDEQRAHLESIEREPLPIEMANRRMGG